MDAKLAADLDRVFAAIEREREGAVADLARYVQQPSISAQGIGLAECAELTRDLLHADGVTAEIHEVPGGPPLVLGRVAAGPGGDSSRTLFCYAHYDVQPVEPVDRWTNPPFGGVVRDGRLWGRGASDNKSGVLAFSKAARAWRAVAGGPPVNLLLFVEGEEEIGSVNLGPWVAAHPELLRADGMLCLDGGSVESAGVPEVALGLKAILYVELRVRTMMDDVHSLNAAIVPNAAWRLVEALATLRAPDGTILIPDWLDGYQAPTAADEALVDAEAARVDAATWRRELGIAAFANGRDLRDAVRDRRYRPTCNICGLTAGYQGPGSKTIAPAYASAKLDFRLPPDLKPEIQEAKLRRHLDAHGFTDVEIGSFGPGEWPVKTPPEAPVAGAIERAAARVFGAPPLVMGLSAEGTILQHVPMPLVLTGFSNADCNLHAPNENIVIDDYIRGIKYAAAIYAEFAGGGS
jgi:acetylornithine deacetylase/succinyl-diaminopimelate desuccinylase-like protein